MRRGELHIGGSVVFTTILRVVTTQNTRIRTKFRKRAQFTKKMCYHKRVIGLGVTGNQIWYATKVVLCGKY
jgi:hypothetical protein